MVRKTKADAEATRQGILDAAERLFYRHGVLQTSLEQIAAEAGVTRGAVYWHFRDKVDLFKALHESIRLPQEDFIAAVGEDGHPDPLGFLAAAARDCVSILAHDERRQRICTILACRCEYVGEMAAALERQRAASAEVRANMIRVFEHAARSGLLSPAWTPAMAARVFECTLSGVLGEWLRNERDFDVVAVSRKCIEELFRSFRAGTTPPRDTVALPFVEPEPGHGEGAGRYAG